VPRKTKPSQPGRTHKARNYWSDLSRAAKWVVITVAAAAIGAPVGTLATRLSGGNGGAGAGDDAGVIPRFDGVAGHLEESRAILSFLEQHDGERVLLDVSFPDLSGSDDYIGNVGNVTYVQLFTECNPDLLPEEKPEFAKGCLATSLELREPATDDSGGFLQHGVPVFKGYFTVDVTGALQMGVSPIYLRPLTFEQATGP
jgi:hypothetical protein